MRFHVGVDLLGNLSVVKGAWPLLGQLFQRFGQIRLSEALTRVIRRFAVF
jgi:hypothetical protein